MKQYGKQNEIGCCKIPAVGTDINEVLVGKSKENSDQHHDQGNDGKNTGQWFE